MCRAKTGVVLLLALALSQASAAPTKKPNPAAGPKLDGWQDLRWGMTTAQVVAVRPEARALSNGALRFATQLLDGTADVWATFGPDGLEKVEIGLHGPKGTKYADLVASAKGALREKYGEPSLAEIDEDFRKTLDDFRKDWTRSLEGEEIGIKAFSEGSSYRKGHEMMAAEYRSRLEGLRQAGEESWLLAGGRIDLRFFGHSVSILYTSAARPRKPGAGL